MINDAKNIIKSVLRLVRQKGFDFVELLSVGVEEIYQDD